MSLQNPQPTGRHARIDQTSDLQTSAHGAQPDVGSPLSPPQTPEPPTGTASAAPDSPERMDSAPGDPQGKQVHLLDDSQEPNPSVAPAQLGSEATGEDVFPSPDLVYGRIPISDVHPVIDDGRFPATAIPGEDIRVAATVFREGHDALGVTAVLFDPSGKETQRVPMVLKAAGSDRYEAYLRPSSVGRWSFAVEGWSDLYETWRHAAEIKIGVRQDVELMFREGQLIFDAAARETSRPQEQMELFQRVSQRLGDTSLSIEERFAAGSSQQVQDAVREHPMRDLLSVSRRFPLEVEREAAGRGAWYEFFPRSEGAQWDAQAGEWISGTFRTAIEALDRAVEMGFDVVYLPPIHPIGHAHRKGPNNSLEAGPGDPGSPWAIGGEAGGHDSIHPELGTFDDFDAFVAAAHERGLEVALDLALQAAPEHPWVAAHPEWFTTRADGSIAYAENPPKKYQDIYPLNFDNDPNGLAQEVLRVVELWIGHGVDIFRVDNPHTKPLWFWEWLIGRVRENHPDTVFLAEAFTRPAMMQALAKAGFQQSYSYFTWRNTKEEIEEYLTEVSQETAAAYRPNFFVNTPDILTEYLQFGGPAAFKVRAALAATSSPLWGMYAGFELFEHVARPGAEEYIDNEKYEFRPRDFQGALERGESLVPYITRLNQIRREHPALEDLQNLTVQSTTDDAIVAYSKTKTVQRDGSDVKDTVIVVVNTDTHAAREATVFLDLSSLDLREQDFNEDGSFWVDDLITGNSWRWGDHNYVRLDPHNEPVHILHIRRSQH